MMAASWMIRGRPFRSRRINRGRHENDEDLVQMDFNKDPCENMKEILTNVTRIDGITEGRRLSYLNNFVKLVSKPDVNYKDFGFTTHDILYCLRPLSFHDSAHLKNASFRAVRHFIKTEEHVDIFFNLKYDFLIARQITAAGIQLCRRVLVVSPGKFTYAPVQAMVSLTHPTHTDNLQSAALAFLAEIAILNPDVFITCGGVNAIIRNLPYVRSPRMADALLGSLLYLLNRPETRKKAGINLHCLTDAVYMDRALNNKNSNVVIENSVRWCTTVLVSLLRSWTGILHLCQGKKRVINSVVNSLYLTHLQKPMLEALYEVLELVQPAWTDEMGVALDAVDPSRWHNSFRLYEGFVTAEASALFPHLAKSRVNLVEVHLAVLVYSLLEANLLDAIVHVIVSNDTFLSVRATILLGEVVHLVHSLLPSEVCWLSPGLPNLLSYAVRGRPVTLAPTIQQSADETIVSDTHRSSHSQVTRGPTSCSIVQPATLEEEDEEVGEGEEEGSVERSDLNDVTLDNIESIKASPPSLPGVKARKFLDIHDIFGPNFDINEFQSKLESVEMEGSAEAQERALGAVCALSKLHKVLRRPPTPSLYLSHLISWIQPTKNKSHLSRFMVFGSCDEGIKDCGVLSMKDPLTWNWEIIRAVLKNGGESLRKGTDWNRRVFLRRLVSFVIPGSGGYCRIELGSDRSHISRLTLAALDLISALLPAPDDSECHKLLLELVQGIKCCLSEILSSKSAHDCLLSPQNVTSSLCQDYFLMLGHLTSSNRGRGILEKSGIYQLMMELVVTTNHDYYVKLIVSTLDYSNDDTARKILSKVFESKSISSRMYATRFLHSLIRIGIGHNKSLMNFIIELIVVQLGDENRNIAGVALATLQEACDSKDYIEAVIEQRPCLLRLGDNGLLLLVRCLSTERGFKALQQGNFVHSQLNKWEQHFNYRYVTIVEWLLCESLVCQQNVGSSLREESGKVGCKEAYLPPHLYQQLASHRQGLAILLADDHLNRLTQILEAGDCSTDESTLEIKAALYALSGVAFALDSSVIVSMIRLATTSEVYSVRATAFFALSNVATTEQGVQKLHKLGWYTVRHNRHTRWPLVRPVQISEEFTEPEDHDSLNPSESNSEGGRSGLFNLAEDQISEMETEEFYWGIPGGKTHRVRERKSATLPHSVEPPTYYHNRSYSESKAETSDTSDYRYELGGGRKSRSNSYTDSSTSGDSSYGNRHYSMSDRMPTLSPIPSSGSLTGGHPLLPRRTSLLSHLSRSSLRDSRQSILKSLEEPTEFPLGLITYGELHRLSPASRPRPLQDRLNELGVKATFSTIDPAEEDDGDRASFRSTGLGDPRSSSTPEKETEDTSPCYMGICVPAVLGTLFPKEDKNLVNHHVAFMSENLNVQGLEGLKNPSFHKEICFLGSRAIHNTMISTSESEGQYIMDSEHLGLEKDTFQDNSAESSFTDIPNIVEKPMPIIFKSPIVIRSEISRMVEQLSNPILHKTCKQSLLQIKQAHGNLFQDICVFSDVCYILSTCHIRIASRDFIHELFDTPFHQIWTDAVAYLEEARSRLEESRGKPKSAGRGGESHDGIGDQPRVSVK